MNRAGFFFIDVNDGFIDDYKIFLLREIKKILSHLTIICNENLPDNIRKNLEKFADEIAFDKKILADKNNFSDYDELILFDDSFFAPIYPFAKMFSKMDAEKPDADFWGITFHGEILQEYFLVFRKKILHSEEFKNFWQVENKISVTEYFSEKNFTYAAYCDTREWEKIYDCKIDVSAMIPEKLLKDFYCPVLSKKIFSVPREKYLKENYGDEPGKCLDFIKNSTNYDVNLILKNILRENNIAVTKSILALNYVLPTNSITGNFESSLKKTAVVAYLYYEDLFAECAEYLCNVPKKISVIVTTNTEEKKSLLEKLFQEKRRKFDVRVVDGRGRDWAALLAGCADVLKNFKYLCFVHDKKSVRKNESVLIGKSFSNILWQNVLYSEIFIKNVIATFENDSLLGVLIPPQPYHGNYQDLFFAQKFWSKETFEKTLELAEKFDIPKKFFDIKIAPLSIGTFFWCRTDALKKIFCQNWTLEDFPKEPMPIDGTICHALERIFPFAAQAEGFFTGTLMTEKFSSDNMENFISMCAEAYLKFHNMRMENINLEEKLKSELAQLEEKHKSEVARLEEKNKNLSLQLDEQKKLNSAMINSASWKVTKPLRKISEFVRSK